MVILILGIIGGWVTLGWLILRCPQRQKLGAGWSRNSYGMSAWRWLPKPTPAEICTVVQKKEPRKEKSWIRKTHEAALSAR